VALCVVRKKDGAVLVRAASADAVVRLEGNFYFAPADVDATLFAETGRVYHCPHKGICDWLDLATDKGLVVDATWIYREPLPAYQRIAGRYGFYGDHRYYHVQECD
jgi:uncharacterized protein (DUF427 family)